jgi:hypothetical protein
MKSLKAVFKHNLGASLFKLKGWKTDYLPKEAGDKFVLIGFPHNTNNDAPLGVVFSLFNNVKINPLIKKDWFFWPMNIVFNRLGFIPIDRSLGNNVVKQITDIFSKRDKFVPVILPEGTRSDVKGIKVGFWNIAKNADVPIVLLYKNNAKKHVMILGYMKTSDSLFDDLLYIQKMYKKEGYDIPMGETLERLRENS